MACDYDVAVIGGGPGGYVAAIRAAQLGAAVALIEEKDLGGVCLNRGCIPTKTLLASVSKWRDLKNCREFGLTAGDISFDFTAITARREKVAAQLRGGIAALLKSQGVKVLAGHAALLANKSLSVQLAAGTENISAGQIIIAAGSKQAKPPVPGANLPGVLDSDGLLALESLPASMVIAGAGVVGLEFAVILQNLGCEVTVVEMLPGILTGMDRDIVNRLGVALKKQGIKIITGTKVKEIETAAGGLSVTIEGAKGEQKLFAEKTLMAAGRVPVLAGLGLEAAGIAFTNKGIDVDEYMQTNIAGIYAVGDITGRGQLAHAASAAGMAAAENACGRRTAMSFANIPACVFTLPEVAAVGLTEQQAAEQGREVISGKMNFAGNGKALALGETEGFVKIIADKHSGVVLGVHIMGPHASDLIMEGAVAAANCLTARQLAQTIHPHPTLSETLSECAHGIFGEPVHQMKVNRK